MLANCFFCFFFFPTLALKQLIIRGSSGTAPAWCLRSEDNVLLWPYSTTGTLRTASCGLVSQNTADVMRLRKVERYLVSFNIFIIIIILIILV